MTRNTLKGLAFLTLAIITVFPLSRLVEKTGIPDLKVTKILARAATQLDERTRLEVAKTVSETATKYGIDPVLILAVMKVESTFNPKAISNAKAYGLMQVRSIVVKDVAPEMGILPQDQGRLLASHTFNIQVGVHYLSKLIIKFGGDIKKALMAYNAGPTTVERNYKGRSVPSGGYQGRVLKAYKELSKS